MSAGPFLDQMRARRVLERCLESERVPPALLFVGPRGTGKEEAAIAFAAALNCTRRHHTPASGDLFGAAAAATPTDEGPDLWGCGVCSSCSRISRYAHPDVVVRLPLPRPKSNPRDPADPTEALAFKAEHPWRDPVIGGSLTIGIADVRALIPQLAYAPNEARHRVIILREVERMTDQAQNALLKSLEEPPSHTAFILTTHQPDRLLPTVLSRCQRVPFGPLPEAAIERYLREQEIEAASGMAPSAVARGSLKRAILVAEEGVVGREDALRILHWGASADRQSPLEFAAGLTFRSGGQALAEARAVLDELVSLTRDLAALAWHHPHGLLNPDQAEMLESIASTAPPQACVRALEASVAARGEVDRNVNLALIYSTLSLALSPLGL